MKLEQLPNELLLISFEFLSTIDLFRAFNGLNSRIDNLLYNYDQKYHFDFRSISKYDLEIMCQDYLRFIVDQVISLHLSDNDETPILSHFFLSHDFTLDQFSCLQSLSLHLIDSPNRIHQIISQCRNLLHLTHLSLIKCNFWHDEKDFQCIINNIWSLPKLTHCKLDYNLPGQQLLDQISVYSLSIIYLSMKNIHCNFHTLSHILKYTPNLRELCTTIFCGSRDEQLQTSVSSIMSLTIIQKSSLNTMINLFHNMFNLCYLTLETNDIYLDGHQWEAILIEHLPNIKTFQLRMYFQLASDSREDQVDVLLNSFRTSFWLEKHQWFVRCDWSLSNLHQNAILYTLPYSFHDFVYDDLCQSKSTLHNHRNYRLYDRVNSLQYLEYEDYFNTRLTRYIIRFSNIRHLYITLPFHNQFWSVVPVLKRLITLDVMLNDHFAYCYLQALLNQATHLYSLTFRCLKKINMALFQLTSRSIRRLDFISMSTLAIGHFNSSECDELTKSSLGEHCQVLLIKVQKRTSILHLIQTMPKLRSLVIQCEDENRNSDELLRWLRGHVPSTYLIHRNLDEPSKIHLWVG